MMKDQEKLSQHRQTNDSVSLHLFASLGPDASQWTTESTMVNWSSNYAVHEIGQDAFSYADPFASEKSPGDYYASSPSMSPPSYSPYEVQPSQHSPYLQPTVPGLPTPHLLDSEPVVDGPSPQRDSFKILSVSTAFNVGTFTSVHEPDLVLVSSDETLFYVHSTALSGTGFHTALGALSSGTSASAVLSLYPCPFEQNNKLWVRVKGITADELNIVLHALYNTSCANHRPRFDTVERAVDKMTPLFGLVVNNVIVPSNEFYNYLLTIVPMHPLRIYALAARYQIHNLAIRASSHLLSYPIAAISDEECERMGATYLRKLFVLQMERKERLIGLLFSPPHPHRSVTGCGIQEQKVLERLWAGALVNLTYDLRADVSSATLQRAFEPLKEQLSCSRCVHTLQIKINEVIRTWVSIKYTI